MRRSFRSKKTIRNRSQRISFLLSDSNLITPLEGRLIQIINSRPQYYRESLCELAERMHRSVRTVQRVIAGLVEKGLLIRTYSKFKKLVLRLTSLRLQDEFAKGSVLLNLINKINSRKPWRSKAERALARKSNDAHQYVSSATDSNQTSILNPLKQEKQLDLEQIKERALARFRAKFK